MGTMEKKKQRCESLRYSREKQTRVGEEREKKRERERKRETGVKRVYDVVWKKDQKTNQERHFKGCVYASWNMNMYLSFALLCHKNFIASSVTSFSV